MAHCSVCHHTFSTVGNFDYHRSNGRCRTPSEMRQRGLRQNGRDTWLKSDERDTSEIYKYKGRA